MTVSVKTAVVGATGYAGAELTRLLQLALNKGAKIVKGTEMFLRQAAIQFQAFTGKEPPVEEFRRVLSSQ